MRAYIFDIDGTLANGDHRLHHIQKQPKDWRSYFAACAGDEPIPHIVSLCRHLMISMPVVFVSGRSDECRSETLGWLWRHVAPTIYPSDLFMRRAGDHRPDDILKIELLAEVRALGIEPIMVFDDRNRVVAAWRAAGIPCAQVAEGDF